jgi:hypothetical protein
VLGGNPPRRFFIRQFDQKKSSKESFYRPSYDPTFELGQRLPPVAFAPLKE